MDKLKIELKEQFLEPKKGKLVSLLIDFILYKAPKLVINSEDLKVIIFEHDHEPFEFRYVAQPAPNIISQDYWLDQFTIDASEADDQKKLNDILVDNNLIKQDYLIWINTKTGERIEMWEIYEELEDSFFADCWQIAKKQTNSDYRCFFLKHDLYDGIDADTGQYIDCNDIVKTLTDEGFEFKMLTAPIKTDIKLTTKPWWKFW